MGMINVGIERLGNNKKKGSILQFVNQYIMVAILLVTIAIFSSLSPYFLTGKNLLAVGLTASVIGIVCIGQTMCILTGSFDMSVGYISSFSGMTVAYLVANLNIPYLLAFVIGILSGIFIGWINGILVTKGRINALIATLATGFVLAGCIFILSGGYSIIINDPAFIFLGTTKIFGIIPLPIVLIITLYIAYHIILKHTIFGRHVYCVGGNPEAAKIAGINVSKLRVKVYMLSGGLASLAGILLTSRMGAAQTTAGLSYPLNSIAAVVLGGTVLAGGEGKIYGTLIGVLIIGILENGLIMVGIHSAYRDIATGIVLICAVLLQNIQNSKR